MSCFGLMKKPTANLRELTRIAFFLRRRALLRLIAYAESHAVWKNAIGKTGVPVFLSVNFSLCLIKNNQTTEKPARGFFPAFFKRGCDSCVGDKPEQSTRT